jgi:hypothetical protein
MQTMILSIFIPSVFVFFFLSFFRFVFPFFIIILLKMRTFFKRNSSVHIFQSLIGKLF